MSLRNIILEFLKKEHPRIVHKGELGRKAVLEWNYENENSGRRCHELEKEGLIRVYYNEKGEAMYQWVSPEDGNNYSLF